MKIENLKPCRLYEDGTLEIYDRVNTITIKRNVFSISDAPDTFYKIKNLKKVIYTSYLKAKVKDKYVYLLRQCNNNEDIYVSLTYWQNIKFHLIHCGYNLKKMNKLFYYIYI